MMTEPGPRPVTTADVAVFAAEMLTYVAVAFAVGTTSYFLAVGAVGIMALWWATFHSPKRWVRLSRWPERILRYAWFGVGLACLVVVIYRIIS